MAQGIHVHILFEQVTMIQSVDQNHSVESLL